MSAVGDSEGDFCSLAMGQESNVERTNPIQGPRRLIVLGAKGKSRIEGALTQSVGLHVSS